MGLTTVNYDPVKVNPGNTNDEEAVRVKFTPKKKLEWGGDWIDQVTDQHTNRMRNRYPLLASLVLNGPGSTHANLRSPENTDKYARLADAYNAKYRYVKGTSGPMGYGQAANFTMGSYEPVNKIETQDQRQMDTRRAQEQLLNQYLTGEESYYQRKAMDEKIKEAWNLVNMDYEQQFFDSKEEMNRMSKLFDMWASQTEEEFSKTMAAIGIPRAQAAEVRRMIKNNDYFGAMQFLVFNGKEAITADQALELLAGGDIISDVMNNLLSPREAAVALGDLKGALAIGQLTGLYNALREAAKDNQTAANLLTAFDALTGGLSELAVWATSEEGKKALKDTAMWAGLGTLLVQILGFLK